MRLLWGRSAEGSTGEVQKFFVSFVQDSGAGQPLKMAGDWEIRTQVASVCQDT